MSKLKLEGIFPPHITPFTREGEVNEEALRTCINFWIESGVSGLVPCGSNGEAPYLSREERKRVIGTVIDEINGKVPVITGTGGISTRETIALTKDAKDLGADAALVVTPFYFKLSNKEIYEHYRAVMEAADLPIIVYNVPKFTGFSLDPIVISQLASKYENVIGVKDSSGSIAQITEIIRLVGNKISVMAGTADGVLPTLMLGGKGAIVAVANVAPKLCVDLYKAFKEGNYGEASRIQLQIYHLNEVLVKKHNQLSAIKEALNVMGLPGGYPRRPALPLDEEGKGEIKKILGSYLS
ncbi:MAG: 4-hydroxy-tetrahydrodipicolinate synthase [Candidatus Bathyarchaeota archaeon BA1]|nr:MAG: 4-hydroxy-tetrahydrodipicolinate synthase [Candidatus Bathyarchaeota archaeon BA1]